MLSQNVKRIILAKNHILQRLQMLWAALVDSANVALSEMIAILSNPSFIIGIELSDRLGAASWNITIFPNDDGLLGTTVHHRDSLNLRYTSGISVFYQSQLGG